MLGEGGRVANKRVVWIEGRGCDRWFGGGIGQAWLDVCIAAPQAAGERRQEQQGQQEGYYSVHFGSFQERMLSGVDVMTR
jgi:hypothetical protein